ncbi:MAG: hypothetical protein ABF274_09410 [Nonlabens sp.]|uniref:hypothetical protein n=1 Tax=Nonlabens sp. TaxID=1888209 RepID=UPI00321BAA3B
MTSKDSISSHSCGLKSAPVNRSQAVFLKSGINSAHGKAIFLFFLVLTSCSKPLNKETIVGKWVVNQVTSTKSESIPDGLWVNKSNYQITNYFRENDHWVFNEDKSLEHQGEVGIWPRPRSFRVEKDQLYFYLGNLEESPDLKQLVQFAIVNMNEEKMTLQSISDEKQENAQVTLTRLENE